MITAYLYFTLTVDVIFICICLIGVSVGWIAQSIDNVENINTEE